MVVRRDWLTGGVTERTVCELHYGADPRVAAALVLGWGEDFANGMKRCHCLHRLKYSGRNVVPPPCTKSADDPIAVVKVCTLFGLIRTFGAGHRVSLSAEEKLRPPRVPALAGGNTFRWFGGRPAQCSSMTTALVMAPIKF